MKFRWDPIKAAKNEAKHGIAFEAAEKVWDDPAHLIVFDRIEGHEERWHAIGMARGILILTVIHTYRDRPDDGDEVVRIIGARKATLAERKRYDTQDD